MRVVAEALRSVQAGSPYMYRVRAGSAVPPGRVAAARVAAEGGAEEAAAAAAAEGEEGMVVLVLVVRAREVERRRRVLVRGCIFDGCFFFFDWGY